MFQSLIFLFLPITTTAQYGYTLTSNGSFAFIDTEIQWLAANEYCIETFGTSLATITNSDQFNEAKQLCATTSSSPFSCWIGFTDLYSEGDWKWIDDVTSPSNSYEEWFSGNPNGGSRQNCGALRDDSNDENWGYSSQWCTNDKPFFCNIYYNNSNSININFEVNEQSYILSSNNNYALVTTEDSGLTWLTSNEYCVQYFGTSLASVTSVDQFNEISELCKDNVDDHECWIGLTDLYIEGDYRWIDNVTSGNSYSFVSDEWYDGSGHSGLGYQNCVYLRGDIDGSETNWGYDDSECTNTKAFVCNYNYLGGTGTSYSPSYHPTVVPTPIPSVVPSDVPSDIPSDTPTIMPSMQPTSLPTMMPSVLPSVGPTAEPTMQPTVQPSMDTDAPTMVPVIEIAVVGGGEGSDDDNIVSYNQTDLNSEIRDGYKKDDSNSKNDNIYIMLLIGGLVITCPILLAIWWFYRNAKRVSRAHRKNISNMEHTTNHNTDIVEDDGTTAENAIANSNKTVPIGETRDELEPRMETNAGTVDGEKENVFNPVIDDNSTYNGNESDVDSMSMSSNGKEGGGAGTGTGAETNTGFVEHASGQSGQSGQFGGSRSVGCVVRIDKHAAAAAMSALSLASVATASSATGINESEMKLEIDDTYSNAMNTNDQLQNDYEMAQNMQDNQVSKEGFERNLQNQVFIEENIVMDDIIQDMQTQK